MANVNNATYIGGVQLAGRNPYIESFVTTTADTTAIGIGAFVKPGGSSAVYSGDGQIYATVTKAGSADAILGRVTGVDLVTDESTIYREASTIRKVFVNTDPDQIFEIQADGAVVAGDVGLNVNIVDGTSIVLGRQQEQADISTVATTSTLQLKIIGIAQKPDNEISSYAKLICKINSDARANNQVAGV